jgi:hypothetical protein
VTSRRGGRFIGDQEPRPRRQRHGDHGALPQATGKLMRKLLRADFRLGNCGQPQGIEGLVSHFAASQSRLMRADGFFNLRADAHHRVQRCHRLLKHHGDLAAAHVAPLAFSESRQFFR